LCLLSEREQNLLAAWNETHVDYPNDGCFHQLFEVQVEETPDVVALVSEREQLTYRELNERANQLGNYLRTLGVGPEVLVGICMERSVEMIVGLLGVLKAGGAYVPLDPQYPRERLKFTLEDAEVKVLLTQRHLTGILPEQRGHVVCLDTEWKRIAQESPGNVASDASGANLAYVIYTSGSTGRPKGAGIEHHSTRGLMHWARSLFGPEQTAGVLAATSICFDMSVFEIFVPLCWGGAVILAENALQLPTLPAAAQVTLLSTVPSAMAELVRIGVESLRAVRRHELHDGCADKEVRWGDADDWATNSEQASLCPRRTATAGAVGCNGRVVHERRGTGALLRQETAVDGRAFYSQPLQPCAWRANVQNGRSGSLP
jgi:non-ribosomal peptide synthetase component F